MLKSPRWLGGIYSAKNHPRIGGGFVLQNINQFA